MSSLTAVQCASSIVKKRMMCLDNLRTFLCVVTWKRLKFAALQNPAREQKLRFGERLPPYAELTNPPGCHMFFQQNQSYWFSGHSHLHGHPSGIPAAAVTAQSVPMICFVWKTHGAMAQWWVPLGTRRTFWDKADSKLLLMVIEHGDMNNNIPVDLFIQPVRPAISIFSFVTKLSNFDLATSAFAYNLFSPFFQMLLVYACGLLVSFTSCYILL